MNSLQTTLQDVPWIGLIPVILVVLVGVLLWAAGRKVLPGCLAMLGLLIGAGAGWVIGDSINTSVPPWAVAVLGGVLFALVAALAYRMAVMAALAVVFGIAAPLTVLTVHDFRANQSSSISQSTRNVVDQIKGVISKHEETLDEVPEALKQVEEDVHKQLGLTDNGEETLKDLRSMVERLIDGGRELWTQTPEKLQPILAASAVLGGFLGIIVGLLIPSLAAAVVTSMGGSVLWLSGAHVLALRLGMGDSAWMPATNTRWLLVWLITSVVGFCVQWYFRGKKAAPADKSA